MANKIPLEKQVAQQQKNRICPRCGTLWEPTWTSCENCRNIKHAVQIQQSKERALDRWRWMLMGVMLMSVVVLVLFLLVFNKDDSKEEQDSQDYWQETMPSTEESTEVLTEPSEKESETSQSVQIEVTAPKEHQWLAATCTTPRTCSDCGMTEGTPLGHLWTGASCTAPKTCSVCFVTEGLPLVHQWQPATHTAPETCSLCGQTRGTPLPASVDIESQITAIRTAYYNITDAESKGILQKQNIAEDVTGYFDDQGSLVKLVVMRGRSGIGTESEKYSRSYYFHDGALIFAFFEGKDSHRLYFSQSKLIRWIYRDTGIDRTTDYTDSTGKARFTELEQLALNEVQNLL